MDNKDELVKEILQVWRVVKMLWGHFVNMAIITVLTLLLMAVMTHFFGIQY